MNPKYMNKAELSARDNVSNQIRILRKDRGMTIQELAEKANLSQAHLCDVFKEDGDKIPSFRAMIRIFDALGIKEITIKWE